MPIPSPNSGESRDEYMDRCVSFLVDEGKPTDQAVAICSSRWSGKGWNPMPETDTQREMYWKAFDRQRWGFLGWGMNRVNNALKQQAEPIQDALNSSISAAIGRLESLSSDPIREAFLDLYGRVGSAFAMQVFGSFKYHVPKMQTKQVEESAFMEFMREWIAVEGTSRIRAITGTTRTRIRDFLEQSIEDGLGSEEAARLLADQEHIIGMQRARIISRTEIISASNRGSLEGARRTNLN